MKIRFAPCAPWVVPLSHPGVEGGGEGAAAAGGGPHRGRGVLADGLRGKKKKSRLIVKEAGLCTRLQPGCGEKMSVLCGKSRPSPGGGKSTVLVVVHRRLRKVRRVKRILKSVFLEATGAVPSQPTLPTQHVRRGKRRSWWERAEAIKRKFIRITYGEISKLCQRMEGRERAVQEK